MKSSVLLLLFLIPGLASGYTWHPYGPEGVLVANDICFGAGAGQSVICTSDGIRVSDVSGTSWSAFSVAGLPVWEAVPFDYENILLVMGDGSNSDGIYRFSLVTHQFTVLQSLLNPTFIKFCPSNSTWYAGSKYDGLWSSADGLNWSAVPFFSGMPVATMDFHDSILVLSTGYYFQCIYNSSDNGLTWNHANGNGNYLTCLAFHPGGKLYGIIPFSNSASLRVSLDAGQTWNICFWTDNLNTVGFDVVGNVLAGWRYAGDPGGIARYDPVSSGLTFYNEGLPNRFINRIRYNPVFSSITIFVCTDAGVFYSNDYLTGVPENNLAEGTAVVTALPNPSSTFTDIEFTLPVNAWNTAGVTIHNAAGQRVEERTCGVVPGQKNRTRIDVSHFSSGTYYYRLKAGKYDVVGKFVVER